MKITASLKDLNAQLQRLTAIPGSKGIGGQLLRITADIAGLTMTRSTSECLASVTLEAEVETETREPLDVSFDLMSTALARIPGEEAVITATTGTLIITSGNSSQKVPVASTDEWKEMEIPEIVFVEAHGDSFSEAVKIASKAVGKDTSKAVCMGIHFLELDNETWCLGSDGKRLHGIKLDVDITDISISTEGAHALLGIIGKSEIKIGMTDNLVKIIGADFEIALTQMAEKLKMTGIRGFMFPQDMEPMATIPTDISIKAARFSAAVAQHGVQIEPSKGCVFFIGKNAAAEDNQTKIECKHSMKTPIMVPGNQFVEALEGLGEEYAEITQNRNFINLQNKAKDRTFSICKMVAT